MSGHTPGPWRWEFNKQSKSVYLVGGKPRFDKTVMQFGRWGMHHAGPLFNSQITGNQYNVMERLCDQPAWTKPFAGLEHHASWRMDVTHPDAVLMAAAPDLLAVAKELEESASYWSEYDVPLGIVDRLRAAIAKAEPAGSTP